MTQIHVDVIASVPRALQCDFIDAAMRAKLSCPISRLLNANISMRAKLKPRLNGGQIQPKTTDGTMRRLKQHRKGTQ